MVVTIMPTTRRIASEGGDEPIDLSSWVRRQAHSWNLPIGPQKRSMLMDTSRQMQAFADEVERVRRGREEHSPDQEQPTAATKLKPIANAADHVDAARHALEQDDYPRAEAEFTAAAGVFLRNEDYEGFSQVYRNVYHVWIGASKKAQGAGNYELASNHLQHAFELAEEHGHDDEARVIVRESARLENDRRRHEGLPSDP